MTPAAALLTLHPTCDRPAFWLFFNMAATFLAGGMLLLQPQHRY